MSTFRQFVPTKFVSAIQLLTFDFTGDLVFGETISTQTVTCVVYSGTDPSPSAIISGSASASGSVVTQKVTGGLVGNVYELLCTITTSLSQTLLKPAYLVLIPDLT